MRKLVMCALIALASTALGDDAFIDGAADRLQAYIRVDTTNPPGNETRGVEFFARIFEEHGIDYKIAESAPGRGNIWARIEGGPKPGLVLLNHIDVVTADPAAWSVGPFSGEVRDGYIYGRGALDMKSTCIAQLQAFLALRASGQKLNRPVIFLATADEEAGGAYGAGWLVEKRHEIFNDVGFLLNEGGGGRAYPSGPAFSIGVTEKVPFWLRLTAVGIPGHGSAPRAETATTRLLRAGNRIADTGFEIRVIDPVAAVFAGLAQYQSGQRVAQYGDIRSAVQDREFVRALQLEQPGLHALLRNTCSITRLQGSSKINVVPAKASMELDCRLLPDQDQDAFLRELRTIINDPDVTIQRLMTFSPAISSTDTELYRLIETQLREQFGNAAVTPGVGAGFTDSHFFRDMGISSYGFTPFIVPIDDAKGVHGNDERISIENMERGTRFMIELLRQFTAN